ncbi:MAG: type II secretion system protein [Dehalococcoidales bacterium]|nr:type II secretion system protein [Dehalococcoidales bacterium]
MKLLKCGKLKFLRNQRGFSLIEIIVAVAIMSLIGVGLLTALDTNAKATQQLDEKVVATNLATAYFEAVKVLTYSDTYPDPEEIISIPPQYYVNVNIQYSSDGSSGDGITWVDTYTNQTIEKITITVSREDGKPILTICGFKTKRYTAE